MKKIIFCVLALMSISVSAQKSGYKPVAVDTTKYWPLTPSAESYENAKPHPVYFKLFSPGTLYGDAVRQEVGIDEEANEDPVLATNQEINRSLVNLFVKSPWLFTTTQTAISGQNLVGLVAVVDTAAVQKTLAEPTPVITPVVNEDVEVEIVAEKPNFWTFGGSGSLQFTQNYYTDNWYKGGESNYAMLGLLCLRLKYDNKEKIQWETVLDAKLGFQTTNNDEYRKFINNNDQLRLTSKLGYKAAKNWFYTVQGEATTQFTRTFAHNSPDVIGDFTSPIKTVISVGMDYKFTWGKLTGSLYMAPVAMTWTYVDRLALAERYGNEKDSHSRVTWGPNVNLTYSWAPWKVFKWEGRMYYFTNFDYVTFEWENTLSFAFNKYLSAKVYLYPRFDDSSTNFRSESGSYFMFKEWLSLGLEYSW
ncbi:MAG: DUF3078 domain-containing protein [Bacteroidaceae bacterium]|nr:DUF3078 domain-containing protein [Bacteroidaceae bacterium]